MTDENNKLKITTWELRERYEIYPAHWPPPPIPPLTLEMKALMDEAVEANKQYMEFICSKLKK